MKDLRVEIRIKNNSLYQKIMESYESVKEFCLKNNLTTYIVFYYLGFKISPFLKSTKTSKLKDLEYDNCSNRYIKKSASKIVKALNCDFYDIFPVISHEARKNNFAVEMSSDELISFDEKIHSISSDSNEFLEMFDLNKLNEVIENLPNQNKIVIEKRFGFDGYPQTLQEIAVDLNLSRERIRQIECKSFRLLKRPIRTRKILGRS